MEHREHHRIDLTAAERQRLQELAIQTRSRPTRGTAAYVADWKWLIRRIGRGEIELVERIPYTLPAGLDDAIAANEERQREQEQREEQQRRVQAHTAQKQAVQKMPLKLEQLQMELEPA
jgi:hypothetical protein